MNERNLFDSVGLNDLISFLKLHLTLVAGICDIAAGYKIYESPEDAFIAVSYFSSHPIGIAFYIDEYRLLKNIKYIFTRE